MQWQAVREQFPNTWVVFEAVHSETQGDQFVIQDMAVIGVYNEFWQAWHHSNDLRKTTPDHDYLLYHTSNVELQVSIIPARIGIRIPIEDAYMRIS